MWIDNLWFFCFLFENDEIKQSKISNKIFGFFLFYISKPQDAIIRSLFYTSIKFYYTFYYHLLRNFLENENLFQKTGVPFFSWKH